MSVPYLTISGTLKLSSVNAFKLDRAKMLSSGKWKRLLCHWRLKHLFRSAKTKDLQSDLESTPFYT